MIKMTTAEKRIKAEIHNGLLDMERNKTDKDWSFFVQMFIDSLDELIQETDGTFSGHVVTAMESAYDNYRYCIVNKKK